MRKMLPAAIIVLLILFAGCKKADRPGAEQAESLSINKRNCGAVEVLQAQLAADPSMRSRMDAIEAFTRKAIASTDLLKKPGSQVVIPVVVHVVYNTASQNISDAQIASQIEVLNEDYKDQNA